MPTLSLSDNPPIRTPEADSICDFEGTWWIAHTKPRGEKKLAWDLLEREIPYFLPLVRRTHVSRGRKRRVLMPLFTSYLFFCGTPEDRYEALTTNRICQTLDVLDRDTLVEELASIEIALRRGAELEPCPFAVKGTRCRVTAGPFEGIEGVVIHVRDNTRLVLQVKTLGQAASLEIETDLLEPVRS